MEQSRDEECSLPGFRFHPTEEELLSFYLRTAVFGKKLRCSDIIGFLNIYNYDPRELPGLAKIGEREWYFFVPRDRKRGSGGKPNRTTEHGFWKATGSDRKILSTSDPKKVVLGLKKTLVFYQGRAPHGNKTNWVMNEYRLPDNRSSPKDIVLCKIYMKATSLKVLEQRAAMEEEIIRTTSSTSSSFVAAASPCPSASASSAPKDYSFYHHSEEVTYNKNNSNSYDGSSSVVMMSESYDSMGISFKEETQQESAGSLLVLPSLMDVQVQVPKLNNEGWAQDSFWTQLSPWQLDNSTPFFSMC